MKSALIDLAALECLDAFPRDLDRLLVVVQVSPRRREALQRTFPGAEVIEAWPPGDGPWQDDVERALASLPSGDVTTQEVPLLDCFREAWRRELELVAVARHFLHGQCWLAAESRWTGLIGSLAQQRRGLEPRVAGRARGQVARLTERMRNLSGRGLRLALESRLDPSGQRRAVVARTWKPVDASCVVVSSYVNTTRSAIRLWRELTAGKALLVQAGPGASARLNLPLEWKRTTIPGLLSASGAGVHGEIARCRRAAERALESWDLAAAGEGGMRLWPLLEHGAFGSRLMSVHLPETVASITALRHAIDGSGARLVISANEYSFCDRAALLLARVMGLRSEAVQHGVIDGHYRRDRILADRYWCWDEPARVLMARWGASTSEHLAKLSRASEDDSRPSFSGEKRTLVLFTQPYELIPLRREDLLEEIIPVLRWVSEGMRWPVIVKAHPLESATVYRSQLSGLPRVRVEASGHVGPILASSRAAIVLDSSVVADCRRHGVPCFGIGWYDGYYGAELEAMGYVRRLTTPDALETALQAQD